MAVYRNLNPEDIIKGSEFKININMDTIDGYHMDDIYFKCTFNCGGKCVTLDKDDMIKINNDNYVAPLDSSKFDPGNLMIKYDADIPDDDFIDGHRHEIAIIDTKIRIVEAQWVV